jgi:hypothetical protein
VFVQAKNPAKAMIAYERALDWRELFDLAARESTSQDDLAEIGLRVAGTISVLSTYVGINWIPADDLSSKKRYAEAATVLLDYARDVRQAVIAYVEGNSFSDARRIVSSSPHLGGEFTGVSLSDLSLCHTGTGGRGHPPRRTRNQVTTCGGAGGNEISVFEAGRSRSGASSQKDGTAGYEIFGAFPRAKNQLTPSPVCVSQTRSMVMTLWISITST